MRFAWVHPSWRDLVIEHLAQDDQARLQFLQSSSIHGVLLALSSQGGTTGTRQLPLLAQDHDWDAITDRAHTLIPSLEGVELIALLDTIMATKKILVGTPAKGEADAFALAVLSRTKVRWAADAVPIAPAELIAWLTLACHLWPRPEPPSLSASWAELLPVRAPDLSDHRSVDRFTDWLAVAQALSQFDEGLLTGLGVGDQPPQSVVAFVAEVASADPHRFEDTPAVPRALEQIDRLFPAYNGNSTLLRYVSYRMRASGESSASDAIPAYDIVPRPGRLDVARVLRDL